MSRAAATQRVRRARMVRIDYMPGPYALAVIQKHQATQPPGSVCATNSAVIDSIVTEWAELTGIKCRPAVPKSSESRPEFATKYARARKSPGVERSPLESGEPPGISSDIASARTSAYEFGGLAAGRVVCGAKRHRDGQPCRAKTEPGKQRCRFHGGRSTGPRTPEGKARALANLRQYRKPITQDGAGERDDG